MRTTGLPVLASSFISVCFVIGKSIGPERLSTNPMYQVTFTFKRFLESNVRFVKDLFYLKPEGWFNEQWLIIVWALLAYVAISRRSNHLKFSLIMIVVAPLPIATAETGVRGTRDLQLLSHTSVRAHLYQPVRHRQSACRASSGTLQTSDRQVAGQLGLRIVERSRVPRPAFLHGQIDLSFLRPHHSHDRT
jgi:hypothetical protein